MASAFTPETVAAAHGGSLGMRYADAGPTIAAGYRERTGWEPGSEGRDWV
jgi:hypothetical protein